jgi:hypothetical protein
VLIVVVSWRVGLHIVDDLLLLVVVVATIHLHC